MEYGYQLEEIKRYLSEESVDKLDLMRENQRLIKENEMLKESCRNYIDDETGLHKKLKVLKESCSELYSSLKNITEEFTKMDDAKNLNGYEPYLRAIKILDKPRRHMDD